MANRSPPIGALKAAATPAATPAVVNDRLKQHDLDDYDYYIMII